jgi:hypothetical protein
MSDLLSWLRSTIEGDKAAASEAAAPRKGQEVDLVHIAIHDPRDTIARCDAELKILDMHTPVDGFRSVEYRQLKDPGLVCEVCCFDWDGPLIGKFPCDTLIALADGRRHREGFNPERVSG